MGKGDGFLGQEIGRKKQIGARKAGRRNRVRDSTACGSLLTYTEVDKMSGCVKITGHVKTS